MSLWALIEPLLPPWPESPGPRPVSDRLCLQGVLFVLYNDKSWQLLPLDLGFGSGGGPSGDVWTDGRKHGSSTGCTGCFSPN